MKKINVAELLHDCPRGMELDSTLLEGLEFDSIVDSDYLPIRCRIKNPNGGYNVYNFTKHGCWFDSAFAKCVIFPKGKITWEGFIPPCQFKDGDVVSVIINRNLWHGIYQKEINAILYSYASYSDSTQNLYHSNENGMCQIDDIVEMRLATEEEKAKLFDAIKDNGYRWNAETKTLEELVEPKFKVGDIVKLKRGHIPEKIISIQEDYYDVEYKLNGRTGINTLPFSNQNNYKLVSNKFDITTLKPFDKVLVRDCNEDKWNIDFFGYYRDDGTYQCMTFTKNQCIPYEVNKELLGTTNNPKEYGSE